MIQETNPDYNDKQVHILDIAEALFATKGFEGTSVRDIAKEASVNIAMISYYFGSKEQLLENIFARRISVSRMQLEEVLKNEALDPLEKVYQLIGNYVERIMNQQEFHKLIVREQMAQKESPITKLLHGMKKQNLELIRRLIQEGQKEGVFKKNIDIPLMMTTMVGTANQLISTQHYYRELNNLQAMPEEEFRKLLKKKLSIHLKTLFKAILTYEQK